MKFIVRVPETKKDFEQCYNLRWDVLRKPLNKPWGSEKDNFDSASNHIMICNRSKVVGVGRIKINSSDEAQIDYVAVDEKYRKKGVGRIILKELEYIVKERVKKIILHSRENSIEFYRKNGYDILNKSYISSGIVHYKMIKLII